MEPYNSSLDLTKKWEAGDHEIQKPPSSSSPSSSQTSVSVEITQQLLTSRENDLNSPTTPIPVAEHELTILTHSPTSERRVISEETLPFPSPALVIDWNDEDFDLGSTDDSPDHIFTPSASLSRSDSLTASSSSEPISLSSSSASSSAPVEATSIDDVTSREIVESQKEIMTTLSNHMVQTKIDIAVLESYRTNNPKLSEDDQQLLNVYLQSLKRISEFDERAVHILEQAEGGGNQATLNAYNYIWGRDSIAYSEYVRNVSQIIDLSPHVGALLADSTKLPPLHTSFSRYVNTLNRKATVRTLRKSLIHPEGLNIGANEAIHDMIRVPATRKTGSMYMQWVTRIPLMLNAASVAIEKQGGNVVQFKETLTNVKVNTDSFNRFQKESELLRAQNELIQLQSLSMGARNKMSLEELDDAVNLITNKLSLVDEFKTGGFDNPNIDKKLSRTHLRKQLLDLKRLQLLKIQDFNTAEMEQIPREKRTAYIKLIAEVEHNLKQFQAITPFRRQIHLELLLLVKEELSRINREASQARRGGSSSSSLY